MSLVLIKSLRLHEVPTPHHDNQGNFIPHGELDVDAKHHRSLFKLIAEYIRNKIGNANLQIIAVCGIVNTMLLKARQSTHYVDVFGGTKHCSLLQKASKYAQSQSEFQRRVTWLNNTISSLLMIRCETTWSQRPKSRMPWYLETGVSSRCLLYGGIMASA
jgi:hypothetical protein